MKKRRFADTIRLGRLANRLSAFAVTLCLVVFSLPLHADGFLAGGICYDITASGQVTVVANENPYSGYVSIPSNVTWQGVTYQVTAIGEAAFYGCNKLTNVTIPASIQTIGSEAFGRCFSLRSFTVDEASTTFKAVDGVLMNKLGTKLIAYPNDSESVYTVPSSVVEIAPWAFLYCSRLTEVKLPANLTTIGDAAFYGCSALERVNIPNKVATIGLWAFSECSSLTSLTLPALVSTIGDGAFSFCSNLTDIFVKTGNTSFVSADGVLLDYNRHIVVACPGAKGPSLSLEATIDSIRPQAFYGCKALTSLSLPSALSAIGQNPFVFCENLAEINVDQNNVTLASRDGVLMSKDGHTIVSYPNGRSGAYTIPNSVASVEAGPFLCSTELSALTVPSTCTAIGNWAFLGCTGLGSVSLPPTLSSLGTEAFSGCTNLQTVISGGAPLTSVRTFDDNVYSQATLYVPHNRMAEYMNVADWNRFEQSSDFGLYTTAVTVGRGQRQKLPICLSKGLALSAVEFDVTLPDGTIIDTDANRNFMVELTPANVGSHMVSCRKLSAGKYRLNVSSPTGLTFAKSDTLLTIMLLTALDTEPGTYNMQLSRLSCVYATADHQGEATQKDMAGDINVRLLRGDVNRNGRINVADIMETVNYTRGTPTANFHFDEADINDNGEVNTADAVLTIDQIHATRLTAWWSEPRPSTVATNITLNADDITYNLKCEAPLVIHLKNTTSTHTAFQAELVLPKGFLLSNTSSIIDLSVARISGANDEQTVYSLVYAPASTSFTALPVTFRFTLLATALSPRGFSTAVMRNMVVSDQAATEYLPADVEIPIEVVSLAAINNVVVEHPGWPADVYNLEGVMVRRGAMSLNGLPRGIYIVNGRRVIVK